MFEHIEIWIIGYISWVWQWTYNELRLCRKWQLLHLLLSSSFLLQWNIDLKTEPIHGKKVLFKLNNFNEKYILDIFYKY